MQNKHEMRFYQTDMNHNQRNISALSTNQIICICCEYIIGIILNFWFSVHIKKTYNTIISANMSKLNKHK